MKTLVLCLCFLSASSAFANRESGGVGAPMLIARCYELDEDFSVDYGGGPGFQVTVGRFYPDYNLVINLLDRKNGSTQTEVASENSPTRPGQPLSFMGRRFHLSIMTASAPIFENKIYTYAELSIDRSPPRRLKCEMLGDDSCGGNLEKK